MSSRTRWIAMDQKLPEANTEVLCTHLCENCIKTHIYNPKIWIAEYAPDGFWGYPREYYGAWVEKR